jgi:uncharacterized protein YjdB
MHCIHIRFGAVPKTENRQCAIESKKTCASSGHANAGRSERGVTTKGKKMNSFMKRTKALLCAAGLLSTALLVGCGGGGDNGREPILGLPAAALVSVAVSPATGTIPIGGTQQFVATATYADGASRDVTALSTWTSATPAVATVNSTNGLATGISGGAATIAAAFTGLSGSATLTVTPAVLVSMTLTPANPSIAIGATQQFTVTGTYSDASIRDITSISTFASASPAVATINAAGLAIGLTAGTSVITATSGSKNASTVLTVNAATLVSLSVAPPTANIAVGGTQAFTATGTFSNGTVSNLTNTAIWSSGSAAIATVSAAGLATGTGAGTATITATSGGKSASATVTVTAPTTLVSITVTPANSIAIIGGTQPFVATGSYSDGTNAVITNTVAWTSGTTTVGTVLPGGIATGLSGGATIITASLAGKSGSANFNVTPASSLVSITVTPAASTAVIGGTQPFVATGSYTDGTNAVITNTVAWTSGTTTVGTVQPSGIATGVSGGSTIITASLAGKSGTATFNVTPANTLVSIAVTPAIPSIVVGATQPFVATGTFSNGTSADITSTVTWTSASPLIGSILPSGVSTGIAAGSSTITASLSGKTGTATLNVTAIATLASIAVTPATAGVLVGGTQNFVATGTFTDGTTANISNTAAWSSGTPSVGTVSSTGTAIGVAAGSTLITASANGKSGNATLTVTVPASLVSIAVTPATSSIAIGGTQAFLATGTFSDGTTANITGTSVWSSGSPLIASVSASGVATGISAGTSLITATSNGKSGTANLTVTAAAPLGINLRSAANFGVLAGTAITNNSGGLTLVTGDVGSPSQTVDPVQVAGYTNYKSGAILTTALADLQTAITDANSRTCDVVSAAGINLGGQTFTPGVYCYGGSITMTGTFAMNGPGLYIFRTASTLDAAANAIVALNGGATADSVFWVPVAPTTLGANSVFKGTIMGSSAAITMGDTATLQNGRVLSGAAVTLRNNVITKP